MATVVKNPDNSLTVTPTPSDLKVIVRWAQETGRTPAKQFEDVVNGFLTNKRNDYRNIDGPTMREKYEALTPAQQAQVDAILGG